MRDLTIVTQVEKMTLKPVVRDANKISEWVEKNLPFLDNPAVFASMGDEVNTVKRDWDAASFRVLLASGMAYGNSVGNLALPLLYSEITEKGIKDWYVDRTYLWETRKNFQLSASANIPPHGLASRHGMLDFDIVAFSCSYLQTALHVGLMLKHAGIAPYSADREESDPLVIMGGHHMYVNSEPYWRVPDVIYIGEFSAGGLDLMGAWSQAKAQGIKKKDFLLEYLRAGHDGIYIPYLYKEEYSKEIPYPIRARTALVEGIPIKIEKAYCHNLDLEAHINERPIVPFLNPGMGTAEIQSSFGCDSSVCSFCSEGQTNKPFRFYSTDHIVRAAKEQMKWSGMPSFTLSAFDGAGHPQKRHLLRRLLEEVSDDVSLLSLRVNEMARDPLFSVVSTEAGNKTLSLGVEGMSERMRAVFNKWCFEEDILTVCERAISSGATKLKFFMIANHPWETEEDRMEWIGTLKKIEAFKEKYGSKCTILTSWTPLVIMPQTALQWEAPTPDFRTLFGLIKGIKDDTGTDFRIGSGGRTEEAYMAQLLQLGDRRLDVVVDWCIRSNFIHYGATPKGTKVMLAQLLASIPGYPEKLGFHTWFRAKPYSEILPWEFMRVGPSKEWLIMTNEANRNANQVTPCSQGCSACGACSALDKFKMRSGFSMKDEDFSIDEIRVIRQKGKVQVARLKLLIDRAHRFIEDEYWLVGLVRAFRLAGLPVDKSHITLVSQRYKFYDYAYGTEYADIGLMEKLPNPQVLSAIAEFLPSGMSLVGSKLYSEGLGMLRNTAGAIHYICGTKTILSGQGLKASIERFLGSSKYEVSVKKKDFKKGVVSVMQDVRPAVLDAWVQPDGTLHLLLKGTANPYEILPGMLRIPRKTILRLDVVRAEIFLDEKDPSQEDFTRPLCPVTGTRLPANLFDEVNSQGLSPKARFDRVKLDIVPTGNIQETEIVEQSELDADTEALALSDMFEEMMQEEFALLEKKVGKSAK